MCVAEALLRIPDARTQDALIRDKLAARNWSSASAADWALLLTGTLARWHDETASTLKQLIARLGEPVVRGAVRQAMRILAGQFVLAETIEEAVQRAGERGPTSSPSTCSAKRRAPPKTLTRLLDGVIQDCGSPARPPTPSRSSSPRCIRASRSEARRVFAELLPRLRSLARAASAGASASPWTPRNPSASS